MAVLKFSEHHAKFTKKYFSFLLRNIKNVDPGKILQPFPTVI